MPSSLTWFLPRTLVCSTRPPVSVCGTVPVAVVFRALFLAAWVRRLRPRLPGGPASRDGRGLPACTRTTSLGRALPSASRADTPPESRNVRLTSIGYALPPRLRDRLTLGGRTCPRKPWNSGDRDSRPVFRYSCPHSRPHAVHQHSRDGFDPHGALLYHYVLRRVRSFGIRFTPDHFRRRISRLVSYYALFKRWLPLSQRPSCLRDPTSLVTQPDFGALAGGLGCFPFDYEA